MIQFETNKKAYLTASKMPYPDKSLVLYLYMNPCSEAAVAQDTLNRINVINKDLIDSALKGSHVGVQDSIWKLSTIHSHIKSCHAQNPSRRVWIDFDIDCKDLNDSAIQTIKDTTLNFFPKGSFAMVRTAGGVHVVVKKDRLKFNPNNYTSAIENALKDYTVDEVKKNDNCMLSIPGTWMYRTHITRVLNKEDFC